MIDKLKIFTFISGHSETVVEAPHEDRINQWLASIKGTIAHITPSESQRPGTGHHVTICLWYRPSDE